MLWTCIMFNHQVWRSLRIWVKRLFLTYYYCYYYCNYHHHHIFCAELFSDILRCWSLGWSSLHCGLVLLECFRLFIESDNYCHEETLSFLQQGATVIFEDFNGDIRFRLSEFLPGNYRQSFVDIYSCLSLLLTSSLAVMDNWWNYHQKLACIL